MRELFVRDGISADSADGITLLETGSLELEELDGGLIRITVSDTEGNVSSVLIHPSSAAPDEKSAGTALHISEGRGEGGAP